MLSTRSHFGSLLLLVLLVLLCAYTVLTAFFPLTVEEGEYHPILLTRAHYAAFGSVAACLLSYFAAIRFFRRVLGATLLLSVFGLVNFLPSAVTIGVALGETTLGINPFSLLLLAAFYFLNRTTVHAFIRSNLFPAPTPQQAALQQREAIDQFKETFARKTDESLEQIVQQHQLVGAAVAAAQELLQERNSTPKGVEL